MRSGRPPVWPAWALLIITLLVPARPAWSASSGASEEAAGEERDPAAWGEDHVGEPLPEYVTGDECLFCHRDDVGPTWGDNAHQRTMRAVDRGGKAFAALKAHPDVGAAVEEATVEMGGEETVRFLKPNGRYGQLALLLPRWVPAGEGRPAKVVVPEEMAEPWEPDLFGSSCAGCHATAVDSEARAFSSPALDCYTCHGAIDINHAGDTSRMLFAKGRRDDPEVVLSICAQCHIRSGRSRTSGLPYPNNFVAGDNLFRDFEVDLSPAAIARLDPQDRHVLENVRAVTVEGSAGVTCLTCHSVHEQSAERHEGLRPQASCYTCHVEGEPLEVVADYEDHSELCRY